MFGCLLVKVLYMLIDTFRGKSFLLFSGLKCQVIWRLSAQSITVQTFHSLITELEDTGLVLLTNGYQANQQRGIRSNVERSHLIKLFLEPWVLPSMVAMTSLNQLVLIEKETA